jgi:membrane protein DedA with SNARE-associated domain
MASWLMGFVSSAGYLGIAVLMFAENVFPPIPSELIMPLAGYLVTKDNLTLWGVAVAGMLGSVAGALPLYYAGRKAGEERIKAFADKHGRWLAFCGRDVDRAKSWFDRHGGVTVLFCRLIPGVRSLISIPAGIAAMSLPAFLAYTAVGTGIWAALLAYAGYALGSNFEKIDAYLEPVTWVVLGTILLLYLIRVFRHPH